ncbi:GNAT family N-acetyltransferase [bacterium]|nr:GNAT family N-acetyltransferase [bacterium]
MNHFIEEIKKRGYTPYYHTLVPAIEWNQMINQCLDVSFYFSSEMINYEIEKYKSSSDAYEAVIFQRKEMFFLFKIYFTENINYVFPIRFSDNFEYVQGLQITKLYSKYLKSISYNIIFNKLPFTNPLQEAFNLDFLIGKNAHPTLELFTDLRLPLKSIWQTIRTSYKSIINKSKNDFMVENNCSPETWKECKRLHKKVSERQTRSDATWDIQFEMVKTGLAKVFYVCKGDEIIGFSLFYISNKIITYAVGAYDRNLFKDFPISHILIWNAIEFFKEKQFDFLYLGDEQFQSIKPDKKLDNINHFKKGFANYYINTFSVSNPIKLD